MATHRLRHNDLTKRLGNKLAIRIIIDTNFLFIPSEFRLDIFEELNNSLGQRVTPIILSPTYQELQKLATSKSIKLSKQAQLGLKLAEKCQIVEVKRKGNESNDDLILRVATEWKCPVATNDMELRRRLRKAGDTVVFLRQKSQLAVEGNI
jgi:rRNA-processing protein FCF1